MANDVNIKNLFATKVKNMKPSGFLGCPRGDVFFNPSKNRFEQDFSNGVILSKSASPAKEKDLIASYGSLFAAWSKGGTWLGNPLEDIYEAKNFLGQDILVQRFAKGVIWCRKDGEGGVNWLSWRDWHAISRPGDKDDDIP